MAGAREPRFSALAPPVGSSLRAGMHAVTGKRIALPYWDWTQAESHDAVFTD